MRTPEVACDEIAARHGLTESAVKTAAHRLRQGFRTALRTAIAQTVSSEEEVDDEIRHLFCHGGSRNRYLGEDHCPDSPNLFPQRACHT